MRSSGSRVTYGQLPKEFDAVLWYSSVEDDGLCLHNQKVLREANVPCWPSLDLLEMWNDRRTKLFACVTNGFVDEVEFTHWTIRSATRDTVVKIGNTHVGEGKILVKTGEEFPYWVNLATLEPFVEGRSVRAYVVNGKTYGVEYVNASNWIKNMPGCETFEVELDPGLADHALRVHEFFGFPISGVDYIVRADGTFRFLEHNHFPGITLHSQAEKEILKALEEAMDSLERATRT